MSMTYPGTSITVADKITEEVGKIGERLDIGTFQTVNAASVVSYIHPGNRLATLVGFSGAIPESAARDVAMQAAAMAPVALDESSIPQDLIEKELAIGKELAIQEGKPEDMAEKIAQGRLKKWFKEATLINQDYIKDNKQSVAAFISASAAGVTATAFCRAALD